ncbi:MAG: RNA polymerase sigma-70 factor (ECF subfamily) [Cryomorphaceae bacterium]|jgi:RNA polymerase sigma-70 factor (ECF subfamily)
MGLSDRDLVAACNGGDRMAMTALIQEFEKPVFNAAFRILGHRGNAEDVAQTVFLKVFENLNKFNPEYRLFSWVYRITINESLNYAKKQRPETAFSEEQFQSSSNLEKAHDNAILGQQLEQALASLSEDYRTVIVLKHIIGCSYSEISEVLNLPEKTVRSRLYSARQKLQTQLAQTAKAIFA